MNYLITVFAALVACLIFIGYAYIESMEVDLFMLMLSFLFALFYVPSVVIRLPVFNSYYFRDDNSLSQSHQDYANRKAAPVMVALFTGVSLAVILYAVGCRNLGIPSFCAAITSGIISFYYESR